MELYHFTQPASEKSCWLACERYDFIPQITWNSTNDALLTDVPDYSSGDEFLQLLTLHLAGGIDQFVLAESKSQSFFGENKIFWDKNGQGITYQDTTNQNHAYDVRITHVNATGKEKRVIFEEPNKKQGYILRPTVYLAKSAASPGTLYITIDFVSSISTQQSYAVDIATGEKRLLPHQVADGDNTISPMGDAYIGFSYGDSAPYTEKVALPNAQTSLGVSVYWARGQ